MQIILSFSTHGRMDLCWALGQESDLAGGPGDPGPGVKGVSDSVRAEVRKAKAGGAKRKDSELTQLPEGERSQIWSGGKSFWMRTQALSWPFAVTSDIPRNTSCRKIPDLVGK